VRAASSGVKVPISLVYRRIWESGNPLLQYGYGSYGQPTIDPYFSISRLSLLNPLGLFCDRTRA
jgi:protease II